MTEAEAQSLAEKHIGPDAIVAEVDDVFLVGRIQLLPAVWPGDKVPVIPAHGMREILGSGHSWEAAISAAGIPASPET